jgi:probable F420-dependent oxidoreductase
MTDLARSLGRVGVWLSPRSLGVADAAATRAAAREIEELGYPSLWFAEGLRSKEAFTHAALLLAATERLVVATGIAGIWGRDAVAANAAANALAEAYPGRFVLGLGVSHKPMTATRGHDYGRPIAATRAYLDALDAAPYDGPRPAEPPPVVLAALRPRMLELARDRTAGSHPYFVPLEHTRRARAALGEGPLLAPELAVLLEPDAGKARALAREVYTGYYLALENYANNLRWLGWSDDDLADAGSDALVDALVAWGDADTVAARVREHLDAGADHVCVQPIAPGSSLGLDQLRALAPVLLG